MFDSLSPIAWAILAIFFGFLGLIWSADRFVVGAASIAKSFGISPMIVGLTVVSFGTSAPEVMISIIAALDGVGDIAVGNAIGSNIANIGLVLGMTLLISNIPFQKQLLNHECLMLLGLTLLAGIMLWDSTLSMLEGGLLLALLAPSIWLLIHLKKNTESADVVAGVEIDQYRPATAILWFFTGLVALVASSKILVWGAETCALYLGVSPLVIGLSVVALGTSLPELAASIMSALKGHHDIAVGNIIGSNIFNLLAVMAIPGIFASLPMEAAVFSRDYLAMLLLTLLLVACIGFSLWRAAQQTEPTAPTSMQAGSSAPAATTTAQLGRSTGALLLTGYCVYLYVLTQSQLTS